jgi:hypothetical protein
MDDFNYSSADYSSMRKFSRPAYRQPTLRICLDLLTASQPCGFVYDSLFCLLCPIVATHFFVFYSSTTRKKGQENQCKFS